MQPTALSKTNSLAGTVACEQKSFDEFYRRSYVELTRALVVALGSLDRGTDAADEAMARAYRNWIDVAGYGNPQGWCFRVGLNYGRSILRKLRRPMPRTDDWVQASLPDPDLWRALQNLDRELRDVLVCRLLLELSVQETSEHLGIPQGTVKSRLSRAKSNLRKVLDHE